MDLKYISAAVGLAAVALFANISMPEARADVISAVGDDSWQATCEVLAQELTGNTMADTGVLIDVTEAIARHYGLAPLAGAQVLNYQVENYCPRWWPNVVAVGATARAGG